MRMALVFLVGSGRLEAELFQSLIARVKPKRVAVSMAPLHGNPMLAAGRVSAMFSARSFGDAIVERFAVGAEVGASSEARNVVERADLIFLSGGDPVIAAELFRASGADAWLREARARGAHLAGGSAGAILLGAAWARWPDEPDGKPFDGGALVECTRVIPDLVVDTHAEEDDWVELRLVAGMLAAEKRALRCYGIPTDGALVVHPDGTLEPAGDPPFVLTG
jgi:cyanophycinase-like exopeptidase